jgi:hypothetical protein
MHRAAQSSSLRRLAMAAIVTRLTAVDSAGHSVGGRIDSGRPTRPCGLRRPAELPELVEGDPEQVARRMLHRPHPGPALPHLRERHLEHVLREGTIAGGDEDRGEQPSAVLAEEGLEGSRLRLEPGRAAQNRPKVQIPPTWTGWGSRSRLSIRGAAPYLAPPAPTVATAPRTWGEHCQAQGRRALMLATLTAVTTSLASDIPTPSA